MSPNVCPFKRMSNVHCPVQSFWSLPKVNADKSNDWAAVELDKNLLKILEADSRPESETCSWFNMFMAYLFREWKDNDAVRRIFLKKIHGEFEDLLRTTAGKIITGITINGYSLGSSLPIIKKISIVRTSSKDNNTSKVPEIFGKSAYVSVKVVSLKGKVGLKLTRHPFSHWSFSFYKEPEIQFQAQTLFEGRKLPQLASLITNQLRRSLRKKHTLPNAVPRMKPFIPRLDNEVYIHNNKLSCGQLSVKVVSCSRLSRAVKATSVYCVLSLGFCAMSGKVGLPYGYWVTHDTVVEKDETSPFGVTFKQCFDMRRSSRSGQKAEIVIIESVIPNSPADRANLKRDDVIIAVDNQALSSLKEVVKQIKGKNRFNLKIQRKQIKPMGSHQLHDATSEVPGESTVERDSAKLAAAVSNSEFGVLDDNTHPGKDWILYDGTDNEEDTVVNVADDLGGESTSRTTEITTTCDPIWNEQFHLSVEKDHRYLNASVWYRLEEKSTFDLMIGYVSVPIMNISVTAMSLPKNSFRNTYILTPADVFRVDSSQSSVRLSSMLRHKGITHEWCGDITLEFIHETKIGSQSVDSVAGL
ncbi:uncharacterized protein TRIADDRAFT_56130 [Trichoplax adhaerens]|uniref:PDZ domain-containing protein n=1 Tax=Trichoplax adhaerens TaxID=10228 RepID=B3RX96_TRIAD|nr:hypothetical protein TRIADDRAFT_56130 [Trichoplax adhaerens]EDV24832.1 hypothetical protein TRIADDRAFT_56130 [Trichoplax adhaerens]|eukprot:XP_002112722.1 hypothetical protein TRIADDRAFT_56130 [Trichoplax adhaerens]